MQLYYKARPADQLAKDEVDFAAAAPRLDEPARRWLDWALALTNPHHHWRDALKTAVAVR